ncbi:MAG: PAS domain-containing protein [Bauldia sp.]
MKHATSRRLHAYWDRIRGSAAAPRRAQVDPREISEILSDTLMLEVTRDGTPRFRLAGTGLCAAYGRELQGADFLSLWSESDRIAIGRGIVELLAKSAPLLFEFTATTERGYELQFEGLLLPLFHTAAPADRLIGVMAPFSHPYWLGTQPLLRQRLGSLHVLYHDRPAKLLRRRTDVPTYIPPTPVPPRLAPLPPGIEPRLDKGAAGLPPPRTPTPSRRPALTVLEGGKR